MMRKAIYIILCTFSSVSSFFSLFLSPNGLNINSHGASECAPNTTIVTTIAATHHIQSTQPQTYSIAVSSATNNNANSHHPQTTLLQQQTTNNNNLLRRLADSQYQSYATALTVTVTVGCLLLLLNVLIFAGIYYQREKQVNDSLKKDVLTENTTNSVSESDGGGGHKTASCSSIHGDPCEVGGGRSGSDHRKHSLQSISELNLNEYVLCDDNATMAHCVVAAGRGATLEKKSPHLHRHATPLSMHHQQQQLHADICHLDLSVDDFKCGMSQHNKRSGGGLTSSQRHSMEVPPPDELSAYHFGRPPHAAANNNHHHSSHHSLQVTLPRYSPYLGSTTKLNQKPMTKEQCNQSTQSELPDVQDVGTGAMDNDVDIIQCHSSRSTENVRASCDAATHTSPPPLVAVTLPRGGILRHQSSGSSGAGGGGGSASTSATPTATKKRVHIQEISV